MFFIGYAIDQKEIVMDKTDNKNKIECKVNKLYKKIVEKNIEFSYVFVRNEKTLIQMATLLPRRFEKLKNK